MAGDAVIGAVWNAHRGAVWVAVENAVCVADEVKRLVVVCWLFVQKSSSGLCCSSKCSLNCNHHSYSVGCVSNCTCCLNCNNRICSLPHHNTQLCASLYFIVRTLTVFRRVATPSLIAVMSRSPKLKYSHQWILNCNCTGRSCSLCLSCSCDSNCNCTCLNCNRKCLMGRHS